MLGITTPSISVLDNGFAAMNFTVTDADSDLLESVLTLYVINYKTSKE